MRPYPTAGVLAALWVPIRSDGALDRSALAAHLHWLKARGVPGILALGSTGEFPRFSLDERKALLSTIAELAAPLPVVANISDLNHRNAAELGIFARELGLPAVAIMPPHFYPLSAADQLAHFLYVAERVELPTFLYNFPELTGNRICLETISAFADRVPMAGIKHSGTEFDYLPQLVALGQAKDFVVFAGADTRLPEAVAMGVAGCIGGMVNFVPELMIHVYEECRRGQTQGAMASAQALVAIGNVINQLTFPLNVGAGMQSRGLSWGTAKGVVSGESRKCFDLIVAKLQALYSQRGLGSPEGVFAFGK